MNLFHFRKGTAVGICCLTLVLNILSAAQETKGKPPESWKLRVMTYNLKFADPEFKPPWSVRRDMQVELIKKYSPDILGTQEGLKEQIDYLADRLPEYVAIGEGRKGGDDDEHMVVFYRRERLRLREMGSFQLSETPALLGSGPAVNPRMVTWARFAFINRPNSGENSPHPEDYYGHWENNKEFYFFNTHFFTGGFPRAKLNSARLIMERLRPLDPFGEWVNDRPIFLVGDFNSKPDSDVYRTFVGEGKSSDSALLKDSISGGQGIDWILYRGKASVISYERIDYSVNGVFPSDHRPIMADFVIAR